MHRIETTARPSVVSIQAGKVRTDAEWATGIFKDVIDRPVLVGRSGIDGDEQADRVNHGGEDKALCAYSADHYAYWQGVFAIGRLEHGAFGENVTMSGASETDMCIGDTWEVGGVVLQVSQPRQPCWKLARKWGVQGFAEQVIASGRTGWYFRVLRGGHVEAGAPCTLIERPFPRWTIAEANGVMYDTSSDRNVSAVLAGVPLLSASWRRTLSLRLRGQ